MKCNCIVAGIDMGPETEMILAYAAYVSSGMNFPLRLLYVLDYMLTPPAYLAPYIEAEKIREETEMAKWQAALAQHGVTSDISLMMGRLHESFVKAVSEFLPELLVIGFRSHTLRPSSSENLIRSLAMPMLVVRGMKSEGASIGAVSIKKVLCAVDFSENSRKALALAHKYARLFSADLEVLHVVPLHIIKGKLAHLEQAEKDTMESFERDSVAGSDAGLSVMLQEAGISSPFRTIQGDSAEKICLFAKEGGHDLIVMGARGLSFMKSVLIGSTAETVLRSSPCPVLIAR